MISDFIQTSFLGGEISPYAQGRTDLPMYRTSLNACSNGIPLEEGAWTRRSGTPELGITSSNADGILRRFEVADNQPVLVEITYSGSASLRFWYFDGFRYKLSYSDSATVTSISAATPAILLLSGASAAWPTGTVVYFEIDQTIASNIAPQLGNRQFIVTQIDATHYSLVDAFTGASVNGAGLNALAGLGASKVRRIHKLGPTFASVAEIKAIDFVQADTTAYMLSSARLPQLLTLTNAGSLPPIFTTADASFGSLDGPYLDPLTGASQTSNSLGSVTGGSGAIAFSCTDGAYTFTSADVGRCIRLWTQPKAWASGTTYIKADVVSYMGQFWQLDPGLLTGSVPSAPGVGVPFYDSHTTTTYFPWQLAPQQANWAYGIITSLVSGTTVNVTLNTALVHYSAAGAPTDTGNGNVIDTWQLGAYTGGHFPISGTYHEGRLWLGGAYPDYFDASQPLKTLTGGNELLNFSPTDVYGAVTNIHGIRYKLRGPGSNKFRWMIPDHQGILCGTQSGEWLIASSNLSSPLTPTDIQAKKGSAYKCSGAKPLRIGNAIVFVQASLRRIMEYVADTFSGKFIARHLNKWAKHLGKTGFVELAYQEELIPVVWACDTAGSLYGCTYRRTSQFGSEDPAFNAWHKHPIADAVTGRSVSSLCSASTNGGNLDTVAMLTADSNGKHYVQLMAPIFDAGDAFTSGRFLDCYYTGHGGSGIGGISGYDPSLYGGASGIKLNGLAYKAGLPVTVTIAGLDCGDYTVAADGSVTLAYQSDPDGLLTATYLQALANSGVSGGDIGTLLEVNISGKVRITVPVVVGSVYTSKGQIVRPESQQETHEQAGPGLGELRRVHRYAAKFVNAAGVSIGTEYGTLRPVNFLNPNGTTLAASSMFSGVVQDTIEDDYSYGGMVTWQITRPYPCTLASIGTFMDTADPTNGA